MRPPAALHIVANFFGTFDVAKAFEEMFIHSSGRLTAEEATFVPDTERRKVYWTARAWLLIYPATVAACVVSQSILPAMFIGLPRLYGAWHHVMATYDGSLLALCLSVLVLPVAAILTEARQGAH